MEFGIRFLPDVGPDERSGTDYWAQALYLNKSQGGIYICGTMKISLCDPLKLLHLYLEDYPTPLLEIFPNAHFTLVSV